MNEVPGRLTADQVRRVVLAHKAAVTACYDAEARTDPSLDTTPGEIVLSWEILPDGSVSAPMLRRTRIDNARVEECVIGQLRGWRFPASDSQTSVETYSFRFPK